jgi:hypothetical protein
VQRRELLHRDGPIPALTSTMRSSIVLLALLSFACSSASAMAPDFSAGSSSGGVTKKRDGGTSDAGRKPPTSRTDGGVDASSLPPDDGVDDDGGVGTSSGSSGTSSGSSGTSSGSPASGCAAKGNSEACFTCCDQKEPIGNTIYFAAYDTCVCDAPGVCASACGTNYCAGAAPSAACATCMNQASSCWDAAEALCGLNPLCKPYQACGQSCP